MIATTTKNGKCVRLTADYHLDTETVYYYVECGKVSFEFNHFGPAARVYKNLSRMIDGGWLAEENLNNLVEAARALGYSVEVA